MPSGTTVANVLWLRSTHFPPPSGFSSSLPHHNTGLEPMSFLSRSRSLNQPEVPNTSIAKPLPALPSFEPIENVPKKLRRKPPPLVEEEPHAASRKSRGNGSIIRRMSHMFRPKRKAPPQNLVVDTRTPSGSVASRKTTCIAEHSQEGFSVESGGGSESDDDIRRPSGLGSAVSLDRLPPSPFSPESGDPEKLNLAEGIYTRARATSSPNLLRSLSLKAKNKLRRGSSRSGSLARVGTTSASPTKKKSRPRFQFPVEVLDLVLSHLPRRTVASLCPLSRSFCSAARINLYHQLDLDSLSPLQLQKLLALLASRRDLTDLIQECICYTWPAFLTSAPPRTSDTASDDACEAEEEEERQLKNTLLAATFTLALQRMSNLAKLTLPHFDPSLLAHHTAFGLRSLTFMSSNLTAEETSTLFAWLDGQINIVELKFPNLEDNNESLKPTLTQDQPSEGPIHRHQPRHSVYLKPPMPNGGGSSPSSRSVTPLSPSFPIDSRSPSPNPGFVRQSLLVSPTLLPLLTNLHATPAILALLQPQMAIGTGATSASSNFDLSSSGCSALSCSNPSRPVQKVFLNISTTLYTGLRPNTIMASLKGSVTHLGVRFCDNVDKRTVDKMLGAVGAILGSREDAGSEEGGEAEDEKAGSRWRGLESLEISFRTTSALTPGMEETLYKTLQTSLPRYTHLRRLHLDFLSSQRFAKPLPREPLRISTGDKVFKFPAPPAPASSLRTRKGSYPLQAVASAAASVWYPNVGAIRGAARRASSNITTGQRHGAGEESEENQLGAQDQARVELWTKLCPSLRTVHLSGVTWQHAPGSIPIVGSSNTSPISPPFASSPSQRGSPIPSPLRSKPASLRGSDSPSPSTHSSIVNKPRPINTAIASGTGVPQPFPSPPPPVPPLPPSTSSPQTLPKMRSRSIPALNVLAWSSPIQHPSSAEGAMVTTRSMPIQLSPGSSLTSLSSSLSS